MRSFHPLLIEAIRDGRVLNEAEILSYAEAIRPELRSAPGVAGQPPLFAWARRAVEGSRLS